MTLPGSGSLIFASVFSLSAVEPASQIFRGPNSRSLRLFFIAVLVDCQANDVVAFERGLVGLPAQSQLMTLVNLSVLGAKAVL